MNTPRWVELGDGVLVRRYRELDQSIGLIVGADACLVIDTRGDLVQGAELAAAVREVTRSPWTVVYTHSHWDHYFGTAEFGPVEIWAHEACQPAIAEFGLEQRDRVAELARQAGEAEVADRVLAVEPILPTRLVTDTATLSVGGRAVGLHYFGRGHTDNDLVVAVPDAGVVFAGDLVEEGAPPSFGDAHPLDWPATVDGILGLAPRVVSPGHGEPVDAAFVAAQRAELALVARLCADVLAGRCSEADAVARSPYPAEVLRSALERARVTTG